MKKSLIALAVLSICTGLVHAETNVNVYGVLDTGYVKETGKDLKMGKFRDSRIGFKGSEDLGSGLKAIFQLEKRFFVHDGTLDSTAGKAWEGASNVGFSNNSWGRVRFGHVDELITENIELFDPFRLDGIGGIIGSTQRITRIDNTARYDSPRWNGLNFGLSYSLGKDNKDVTRYDGKKYTNDGYNIGITYDNGPWRATANWGRVADSADSSSWNAGISYKFGDVRVMGSYIKTKDKGFKAGGYSAYDDDRRFSNFKLGYPVSSEQDSWLLGLEWETGAGKLDTSIQRLSLDDVKRLNNGARVANTDGDIMKYSIGYTYFLSKRTSFYGQVAYTDWDTEEINKFYGGTGRESTTAVLVGMTHKF